VVARSPPRRLRFLSGWFIPEPEERGSNLAPKTLHI
jgi:hypothetical protein